MRNTILLLAAIAISVTACRKKPDPVTTTPQLIDSGGVEVKDGHMKIMFENMVGNQPLELNNRTYVNENGDSFKVSLFKYYISNIQLTRDDDSIYTEPESYHLVIQKADGDADNGSGTIELHGVPAGNYKSITFLLGVDSAKTESGAQTGALDVFNGMYWAWNGYIITKLEGDYEDQPGVYKNFFYHIGGYKGPNNSLRWYTLTFPQKAVVSTKMPAIHIATDISEWFKTPTQIDFDQYNNIMDPGRPMTTLIENYLDMFTITQVEN